MKILAVPSEEEFEALPPALRRKCFSNVERFRMRLAQHDHSHDLDQPSALAGLHLPPFRTASSPPLSRRGLVHRRPASSSSSSASSSRLPRSPGSLQLAYLADQVDSQCFHSLPPKIQQKHFSREEQLRYRQALCRSVILDAADEALYRLDQERLTRLSLDSASSSSSSSSSLSNLSLSSYSSSHASTTTGSSPPYSSIDMAAADFSSVQDSFRWLDEDGDLDLSLDDYHAHVAAAAAAAVTPASRMMKPSFRRTLSFNSIHPHHLRSNKQATITPKLPASSHSATVPSVLAHPPTKRRSVSRPSSSQQQRLSFHHHQQHSPRASTSSIDPAAQYYQDPEARLKLRVYLASPQKFDEALEFGFPALDAVKDSRHPGKPSKRASKDALRPRRASVFAGTFFDDDADGDSLSLFGDQRDAESRRQSGALRESQWWSPAGTPTTYTDSRPQSWLPVSSPKQNPSPLWPMNREMTLKMTLTRPDLRTESSSPSPSSSPSLQTNDPLRLAELPPADCVPHIWNPDLSDSGLMKKVWRKLRKRKI
ncbi:hypothetical protein ASPZODRAFT_913555 [Penicilliopsis zonata CBS 506.65]|uniref:Uncharacterized protein n=1 Tax=Penicilliopsis zonata CBS 506.65 TaxID=1073090 RepID=A0A1L9S953_9EURO|nr:hypothetical protein ASPZODRAFT_913555 [Penicilliopsis zonata CBS 506.65]OJJ43690.1 hypothetical protein ASPZODRAFT_913555 [Penicilliopsis zonata CBS 506.65]